MLGVNHLGICPSSEALRQELRGTRSVSDLIYASPPAVSNVPQERWWPARRLRPRVLPLDENPSAGNGGLSSALSVNRLGIRSTVAVTVFFQVAFVQLSARGIGVYSIGANGACQPGDLCTWTICHWPSRLISTRLSL